MNKIGFATYKEQPELTADDLLVVDELRRFNIQVLPIIWDDDGTDVHDITTIVMRSCWNYHLKPRMFVDWLDRLERSGIQLLNSGRVTRWNLDKHYLHDLAMKGVAVPQTVWVEQGAKLGLATLLEEHRIDQAVVKPAISLSAYGTWRTSRSEAREQQVAFEQLVAERTVMIQPFISQVTTQGELSFQFFGGQYSHTVRKRPQGGDFRVQADFGGTREIALPSAGLIAQAQTIVDLVDEPLLFARVDGIDVDGQLVLMELELIDPVLFLAYDEHAPSRFAAAIVQRLNSQ